RVVAREDFLPHVVDRDATVPAPGQRLPLQLGKAENSTPLGEMVPGAVHRHARRKLQLAGRVETPRRHQALLLPLRKNEARLARGGPPVPQERLAVDPLCLRLPRRKRHPLGVAAAPETVRLELALDLPRALGEVLQVLVLEAGDARDPLPPGAAVPVALDLVPKTHK